MAATLRVFFSCSKQKFHKDNLASIFSLLSHNVFTFTFMHLINILTTRIPEMLGHFLNLNKMKTKRHHMSQYFIHNRTQRT